MQMSIFNRKLDNTLSGMAITNAQHLPFDSKNKLITYLESIIRKRMFSDITMSMDNSNFIFQCVPRNSSFFLHLTRVPVASMENVTAAHLATVEKYLPD